MSPMETVKVGAFVVNESIEVAIGMPGCCPETRFVEIQRDDEVAAYASDYEAAEAIISAAKRVSTVARRQPIGVVTVDDAGYERVMIPRIYAVALGMT